LRIKYKINQNVYFPSQVYLIFFFLGNNKDRRITIFYIQQIILVQDSLLVASDGGNCIIANRSATTTIFIENFMCKSKLKSSIFNQNDGKQIIFSQNHFAFLF